MLDKKALKLHEGLVQEADPLLLDLEDEEFVDVIDQQIKDFESFYNNKSLFDRQQKNLDYYMGKQFDPLKVPSWQLSPYVENVVYESVRRILPIVASRMPDLTVGPGSDDQKVVENARLLEDKLNTDATKSDMSKLLGLASVHEQIFFYAVIKAIWNTELGSDGDYQFLNKYPTTVFWDYTCKTNNADDMRFIGEYAELTLKEILMMFPDKKDEFLAYLGRLYPNKDLKSQKGMASTYKIAEVWFHWYKETKEFGQTKWEKINGVVWKYDTFVLGKMKNPYFDYEGQTHLFSKEVKEKQEPGVEDLYNALFGQEQKTDTIYYNYFKNPRKPYFLMVYESLGEDPIDATNRIEQILYFQDHINQEGTQIIQMNEQSAGKLLVNSDAMDKKDIKKIDWHNTAQAISVNGDDINKAFSHVAMPAAPGQLYQSKTENRNIAFEMLGVGQTTRGITQGNDTLGQDQMAREQDFGFLDHLTEETINEAALWISEWKFQFIRLFYTKQHFVEIVGKDGESAYKVITQDLISDGLSVTVGASGVDKQKRIQMAVKNAELGFSDILTYYQDTNQANPKERARRAFLQKASPMQYYQEFLAPKSETPGGVPGPVQPGAEQTAQPPAEGQPAGMPPAQGAAPAVAMAPAAQGTFGATA